MATLYTGWAPGPRKEPWIAKCPSLTRKPPSASTHVQPHPYETQKNIPPPKEKGI